MAIVLILRELFILLFGELVKEKFERRKHRIKNKQELADQMVRICTEAQSSRYKNLSRDFEHIILIRNLLHILNPKLLTDYEDFIKDWIACEKSYKGLLKGVTTEELLQKNDKAVINILRKANEMKN